MVPNNSTSTPPGTDSSIRSVAVLGAGISGVTTAAHLLRQGLEVRVFERSSVAGGIWHYDPRPPNDPDFPSGTPSRGDYETSVPGQFALGTPPRRRNDGLGENDSIERSFSPPGPCYAGLRNNVPTSLMVSSLGPWPEGTEEVTSQDKIEEYVQILARNHGVNQRTLFGTRVEEVAKSTYERTWTVRTLSLDNRGSSPRLSEKTWQFDAIVVATGHYNLPRVPDIPGLKEWKARFGERVIHSKQYRRPETYRDQNVLTIGAGVSSLDVCRELEGVSRKAYQSVRGGPYDLHAALLPPSATRIGEIARFEPDDDGERVPLNHEFPVPGRILLKNGDVLDDIHQVILATGYVTSYPFLSQLHEDNTPLDKAGPKTLVTSDGNMTHNLYKDIFYIEDPTLVFVGVPYYTATFSLFDFQARAVARVLAGNSRLPNRDLMQKEYGDRVREKGLGRELHSLKADGLEEAYVRDLVEWVNASATDREIEPMRGHSDEWLRDREAMRVRMKAAVETAQAEKAEAVTR